MDWRTVCTTPRTSALNLSSKNNLSQPQPAMLLIGLTGSIATGKSTVSRLLSSPPHSLPLIDADVLAREVVAPGTPGYASILAHFGPSTPDLLLPASDALPHDGPDGKGRPLDRAALGRRVFGGSEERAHERKVLNGIVHPAVRRAMAAAVVKHYLHGAWAVVLDVPLLFESRLDAFCGVVLMVGVSSREVQLQRLLKRERGSGGSMTEEEARERVASQGDVEGKVQRVRSRGEGWGEVVWNDAGRRELELEVSEAMLKVRRKSPRWWETLLWVLPPLAGAAATWCFVCTWWTRRTYEKRQTAERSKL